MVWRFEPPPGWPPPPSGFVPPKGWRPDPSWPAAPKDWTFWIWDATDTVLPPPRPPSQTPSTATVQDRVPGPPPTPSEMPDQAMVQDRVTRVGTVTETGSEHPSWRVRHQERHAAKEHTQEVAVWQADQDFADEVAAVARETQRGLTTLPGLLLKTGELPFWSVADASSDDHAVLLHVSNRQKASGLVLGQLGARFQAYLALGVAAGQDGGAAVARRWSEAAEAHRRQKSG
jgi:hypothetical protein